MWGDNPKTWWTIANLSTDMQAAATFKNMHPGARILVGEFGVVRWAPGADQWYSDSISIFEQYGWDWCLNSIGGWNGWSPSYGTNVGSNSVEADGGDRGARWQVISNKWHLNP